MNTFVENCLCLMHLTLIDRTRLDLKHHMILQRKILELLLLILFQTMLQTSFQIVFDISNLREINVG